MSYFVWTERWPEIWICIHLKQLISITCFTTWGPIHHAVGMGRGFFSRIDMYSGNRIIIPGHNASSSRAICGLKECLIHGQNCVHSIKWSEVAQSCLTLCEPLDSSQRGSSVHGIFQARILEWGAISFSRGSSRPRDGTWVSRIVGRHFIIWTTRKLLYFYLHSITSNQEIHLTAKKVQQSFCP